MYDSGARRLILISKTGEGSVLLEFIFQKSLSVREETFECIHSLVGICPFFFACPIARFWLISPGYFLQRAIFVSMSALVALGAALGPQPSPRNHTVLLG